MDTMGKVVILRMSFGGVGCQNGKVGAGGDSGGGFEKEHRLLHPIALGRNYE